LKHTLSVGTSYKVNNDDFEENYDRRKNKNKKNKITDYGLYIKNIYF
jgi:hypothetical protein